MMGGTSWEDAKTYVLSILTATLKGAQTNLMGRKTSLERGAKQVGKMGEYSREGAGISNMEHEKGLQKSYKSLIRT